MPPHRTAPSTGSSGSDTAPGIFVALHAFGPGGVERIALRLIAGWRSAGADVRLIIGDDTGPMRVELGEASRYAVARAWPAIGRHLRVLRLVAASCRAIRRHRPDIIFCPGNSYAVVAVLLRLLFGRDCPKIVVKISNDLDRRDMPRPARLLYHAWLRVQGRLLDRFVVLSGPMAVEAMSRLGIPARRVDMMPNPVMGLADLHPPPSRRAAKAERRFVAVGRLERQKDYPLMLRAFAEGSGAGDTLRILGEGTARTELERLAVTLGIGNRVHFSGFDQDVRAVLRDHDVLLLSSLFEGTPGAIVEALACGMAIVATRCSTGMAALLDDGALGTLVAVGDRAAFADAIRAARPGAQDMARAQAKARAFTIEAAVPAYLALFARVTAPRRAGPWLRAASMKVITS